MLTFDVRTDDLFEERAPQMAAWGIPKAIVTRVRARVRDMWSDARGGWTFEWSEEARAAEGHDWLLAAALHGAAHFPCVCTDSRVEAQRRQVECYVRASAHFPVGFERRVIAVERVDAAGAAKRTIEVPAHVFTPGRLRSALRLGRTPFPIVLLSGGVDTGKMALHRLAVGLANLGMQVAAIDMPGTGETPGPLDATCDRVYAQVLQAVTADAGRGVRKGMIGISFGGHWAAKLALLGEVDAAVDVGGPVGAIDRDAHAMTRLPNGMTGTLANAAQLDSLPGADEAEVLLERFSLRAQGLLDPARLRVPLLVCNGDADLYVPVEDTTVFRGFENAEVILIEDAPHCAGDRFLRVAPYVATWTYQHLTDAVAPRIATRLARRLLPRAS